MGWLAMAQRFVELGKEPNQDIQLGPVEVAPVVVVSRVKQY